MSDDATSRSPETPAAPRRRKRRRLRWFLACLLVLGVIAWLVATRSFVTRNLILGIAGNKLGADLSASSVVIELDGSIILKEAVARAPGVSGPGGIIFRARAMEIEPVWGTMFQPVPRFRRVVLDEPLLRFSQDVNDGSLNVAQLKLPATANAPDITNPPVVLINQGILELGEHQGETFTSLRRIDVDGSIRRDAAKPDEWLVHFRQTGSGDAAMPLEIDGRIARDGLSLTMAGLALGDWKDSSVPTPVRSTFAQLALRGHVGRSTFVYTKDGDVQATLELAGVALNLPVEAQPEQDNEGNLIPLPPSQVGRQLRMEEVVGTLSYVGGELRGDFAGKLEELPYHVLLSYGGTTADAPFTLELTCRGFELGARPQILRFAPGVAQRRFAQFSHPTGIIDATVTLRRAAPEGGVEAPLNVTGDVVLRDGTAAFERFPYRFEKMSGQFRFDEDQIEIVRIQGEAPSGAKVYGWGKISPLTDDAAADIQVEITELPVDDRLEAAMGPRRKILDALFNKDRLRELTDAGLILTPARKKELEARLAALNFGQPEAHAGERGEVLAALEKPLFELGGKARVYVEVQRAFGPGGVWSDAITIRLPDAGVIPEKFGFPLRAHGVMILKRDEIATVSEGTYSGLRGGTAHVDAIVDLTKVDAPDVPFVPDVKLIAENFPVDDILIHAVPDRARSESVSARELLRRMGVRGKLTRSEVTIGMDETGDAKYDINLDVVDGQTHPEPFGVDGPARMVGESLAGKVHVTQDDVNVNVKGLLRRSDNAGPGEPVSLVASLDLRDGATGYDASVEATSLDLACPVEDFVGVLSRDSAQKIADLRSTYKPEGKLDSSVRVRREGDETNVHIRSTKPEVSFDLDGVRVGLTGASGGVVVESGRYNRAALDHLDGDLLADGQRVGRIALDGTMGLDLLPTEAGDRLDLTLGEAAFEAPIVRRVVDRTLGKDATEIYDKFLPRGTFDAALHLAADVGLNSKDAPRKWIPTGDITPRTLTIASDIGDVAFPSVAGHVSLSPGGGQLVGLSVATPQWSARADGSWHLSDDRSLSVRSDLAGEAQGLPPDLLALLPDEVGELAKDLSLVVDGPVTLSGASLSIVRPPGEGARGPLRFEGTLQTNKASATAGVDFTNVNGSMHLIYDRGATDPATYDLKLLAADATVSGIHLTNARARMAGTQGGDMLVPLFSADCHGGRLAGTASVRPTTDGRKEYEVLARVSDARFASVLKDLRERENRAKPVVVDSDSPAPEPPQPAQASESLASIGQPDESRGRLDAEFSLTGFVGDDLSRRGRGSAIVGGERVINVPLLVPLVRISNLQLPSSERLDYASAQFFLSGNRLNFEDMTVSSKTVSIEGVGTADLPNWELDLRFRARNKQRIPLVSQVLESIRNELVTGEVRGTPDNPRIVLKSFAGTRRFMSSVVGRPKSESQERLDELEEGPSVPLRREISPRVMTTKPD